MDGSRAPFPGPRRRVILAQMTPDQRRVAYNADITYGTNNEFASTTCATTWRTRSTTWCSAGTTSPSSTRSTHPDRRGRTPLIISGPPTAPPTGTSSSPAGPLMEKDTHYEVDLRKRTVGVHEKAWSSSKTSSVSTTSTRRQLAAGQATSTMR
ncbi:secA DEAD-like domain protein [Mycobacterium kansasii]|uniref:SecA DEAD-like domain protein n=1 Tax=Mycobacterium kansasii TaxID=1768 RepID=A0A1V3WB59_MYCKA|nr:secA DEAD-like domain protein [Mycobacterium kansasii]